MNRAARSRRHLPDWHVWLPRQTRSLAETPAAAVPPEDTGLRDRYTATRRALRISQRRLREALDQLGDEIADLSQCRGDYWSLVGYEVFGIQPRETEEMTITLLHRQRILRLLEQDLAAARTALAAGDLDRAERLVAMSSLRLGIELRRR
jgi:hypothetical protein